MPNNNQEFKHVVCDNKVYAVDNNPLYTTYNQVDVPNIDNLHPVWKGKKIPLSMWRTIMAFCKHSYDTIKSETLIYLFYDQDKPQPWSYWVPPQETAGMTVKSSPENPEYATQREQYPDTMFGTVHHHCSSSAFQSGTDEADETQREGLHFTIGNLNKDNDFDVHFRMTIGNCHSELDAHMYIEQSPDPFKKNANIPEQYKDHILDELHKINICTLTDANKAIDFTSQMANVTEKVYTPKYTGKKGLAWDTGTQYDLPGTSYYDKKNIISTGDIADDFINAVFMDYEYEEILIDYLTYKSDSSNLFKVTNGTVTDTQAANLLTEMFEDNAYKYEATFIKAKTTIKTFLQEQKSSGLDFTSKDLIHGLATYEEGVSIQHMVT